MTSLSTSSSMRDAAAAATPGSGCPVREVRAKLRRACLRPTRQRMALGWILFGRGHRHVTANQIYREAVDAGVCVSIATVYNTLNSFSENGILQTIIIDNQTTIFDTNIVEHYHFYLTKSRTLIDIERNSLNIQLDYKLPNGFSISDVTMLVRVRDR